MSLPESFTSTEEYFQEALVFLRNHQHLYDFPNTKLLSSNCLEQISLEGLEDKDLFDKDVSLNEIAKLSGWVNLLITEMERLRVNYDEITINKEMTELDAPLSVKKKHEIIYLAQEIKETCERVDCHTVVDFGSGLGYLDQLIYSKHDYNVLGLESCNQNYTSAKKRQRKYHLDSIDKVKYIRHKVNESSQEPIAQFLTDKFENYGVFCITGLHACADLTIEALDIFLKMTAARSIVLMSCCYHKMACESVENGVEFKNFPLSGCLKESWVRNDGFEYMRVPFLRLAAQPPNVKEKLEVLVFNLLARAVVQLYADKNNLKLARKKRKAVKTKTIANDFESYLQQVNDGFQLTCSNDPCDSENTRKSTSKDENKCKCALEFNLEELRQSWREFSQDAILKKAAIFILLQRQLQPVLENLILLDRIKYLKENGVEMCWIKKIFDDTISPRCYALIAVK